ncbi:aldehyde dehydrogenase (NADP(+)) [Kocuria coralli]|uniref:Aldehyde dehydrogenase (NADP(+)) n=1 Tax=Kocuria coralli TaxID=1461025 RepID=A0A5J5L1R0_9MICC|nr:aldehyde dehydrogenase (NADP(+)) [Kocuria coralli]KAA9394901.1 aldehyde dehydrogenase (NADP(+)) [Kocuria coralli]
MNATTQPASADALVAQAHDAYRVWSRTARAERARALHAVADALDANAELLIEIAKAETHLADARLTGEVKRTTFQLRLFAEVLTEGSYLDVRVDHADADWPMGARPDLRRTSQAVGPVIVYAASNFPFAFSVAGGDTASALAAGASVIVKAHAGHPELSRKTAELVRQALHEAGAPDGLFALIETREVGLQVLRDPRVKAGSFTGSIPGGRALFDVAVSRPEPIPFFGELGSVNPTFVTVKASQERPGEIADGFRGSFTMGSGQFCTKPGVLMLPEGSEILEQLRTQDLPDGQPMLNDRIRSGHSEVLDELSGHPAVEVLAQGSDPHGAAPSPTLLLTTTDQLLADQETLFRECFGPTGLLVTYRDEQEMVRVAQAIDGQLTATIVGEDDDAVVTPLLDELREKAGRVLWNQWPTGVSVTYAQQHGGPYPATTAPSTTSVGTAAISRFLRPVAFQGFPLGLLPDELTEQPAETLIRRVDGTLAPLD